MSSEKLTKEAVHSRITEELMASPELLSKFMDSYGTMSIWFCFQQIETNRRANEDLEKKVAFLRGAVDDAEQSVHQMKSKIKSLGREVQELRQQRIS